MNEFKHEVVGYGFDVPPEFAERLEELQAEALAKLKERREDRIESEIRKDELEWVEVLVPSHLAGSIYKMIELFLESHGVNDDN